VRSRPFIFRVQRFDPAEDDAPHYQSYTLDAPEGANVLEALVRIQNEQGGILAFRYACRGAVCGSCASHACGMLVNGREVLACRTQVHGLAGEGLAGGGRTLYRGSAREKTTLPNTDAWAERPDVLTLEPLRNLKVIKDLVVDLEPFFGKLTAVELLVRLCSPQATAVPSTLLGAGGMTARSGPRPSPPPIASSAPAATASARWRAGS